MPYEIKYHKNIVDDLKSLDKSVRDKVFKKLEQLKKNPNLGQPLGNKAGMDLSGFYKLYVDNRRVRIVYKAENTELCIFIIAMGQREDLEIYRTAWQRKNI